jgi:tRNA-dihydrouridine synthase
MLEETGCAAVMFARGAMGNPFIFSAARSLLETGSWEAAPFSVRIDAAMRHLEMLSSDIGERTACLEMRKQFCAYTKGCKGGAALREKAVTGSKRRKRLMKWRRARSQARRTRFFSAVSWGMCGTRVFSKITVQSSNCSYSAFTSACLMCPQRAALSMT